MRIVLKRPFCDGTKAIDPDPLSQLFRLAAWVPPLRYRMVQSTCVFATDSNRRLKLLPKRKNDIAPQNGKKDGWGCRYWPWHELPLGAPQSQSTAMQSAT